MPIIGGNTTGAISVQTTINNGTGGGLGLNLRDYGAKCDVRMGFTGVITNGSSVLTDSNASFTAGDVGKTLWVSGKSPVTISSVDSPTQIHMSGPETYNSSTTAYAYGTDDTAAIAAAISALPARGGTILVPGLTFDTATHQFNLRSGISFQGVGGRIGVNATKGNGFTGGGTAAPASGLFYLGSGATPYLRFVDSLHCGLKDMAVMYGHLGFTGDLIQFLGSNGGTPGMFFKVEDCLLTSGVYSTNFDARCLINLSGAVFVSLRDNVYGCARYHLIGIDPNAVANGATDSFSNAVTVDGGATEFAEAKIAAVLNPGWTWQFKGVTFEPLQGGKAGAVIGLNQTGGTHGVQFDGCGFWDPSVSGGTWIVTKGEHWTFRDCFFESVVSNDIYIDASQGNTHGLVVTGCQFDGWDGSPTGQTVIKPPANGSGFTLTGLYLHGNLYDRGPADPTSALTAASTVTMIT